MDMQERIESKQPATVYADIGQLVARSFQLGWHLRGIEARIPSSAPLGTTQKLLDRFGACTDAMVKAASDPDGSTPYDAMWKAMQDNEKVFVQEAEQDA